MFLAKVSFHNLLQYTIVLSTFLESSKIKENEIVLVRILSPEKTFIFSCILHKSEKRSFNKVKLPIWVKSSLDSKQINFKNLYSEIIPIKPSFLKEPSRLDIEVKILDVLHNNRKIEENLFYFLIIQLSKQVLISSYLDLNYIIV